MSEPCSCVEGGGGCTCGCCEGVEALTPLDTSNRPGLDAIAYRVGTHSSFLETMRARLSSQDFPALAGLTTREESDPALALLDAWAVVADVLTFYQERIANEGYLRTATERRSVRELARLIGYELRPGVSASTPLAFTLDPGPEVVIPAGARAQSVPGPDELPQPFETSEDLTARAAWNNLQVRLTRPQTQLQADPKSGLFVLYFQGIATHLKPNDPLLIRTTASGTPGLYRVKVVEPDGAAGRTRVSFEPWGTPISPPPPGLDPTTHISEILDLLAKRPSEPPSSRRRLGRDVARVFDPASDTAARLLLSTRPELRDVLYKAWETAPVAAKPTLEVWALRTRASVFGHNAPLELIRRQSDGVITGSKEWELKGFVTGKEEGFRITLEVNPNFLVRIRIVLDGSGEAVTGFRVLKDEEFQIPVPGRDVVDVKVVVSGESPPILAFSCPPRGFTVTVELPFGTDAKVEVEGADPDSIEIQNNLLAPPPPGDVVNVARPATPARPARRARAAAANAAADPVDRRIVILGKTRTGATSEGEDVVHLDNSYPQVLPGSWIVLDRPTPIDGSPLVITTAKKVSDVSRAAYGITGKSTWVELGTRWLNLTTNPIDTFAVIRRTAVYAQSELLELAEAPIDSEKEREICGSTLELAALYDGLEPGRWMIVSGERTDVKTPPPATGVAGAIVPGIPAAELVMVADVKQGSPDRAGERTHTTLTLAAPLSYCYRRDTLKILGNVAPATHGETKSEVLGSGDGSQPLQRFTLKQAPLTYVSAPTAFGIESTLTVRVNEIRWHEAPSLFGLEPTDHVYTTRADDEGHTTVIFGDGKRGARLPTGRENVRAVYRAGIGEPGNLGAGRISQLVTRPLGVKDVINPLPSTGGADPEGRDQAKRNAPLAVMALDRLVSVRDYADFSRTFAGVGRASAARFSDGRSLVVHVTIAGENDVPISETSELFHNLEAALRDLGDPHVPVRLAVRNLSLIVVAAGVRLLPDFLWDAVEPKIRAALLIALGFDRRDLAQDTVSSEALRAIQGVPGVDYADLDVFNTVQGTLDPQELEKRIERLKTTPVLDRIRARAARLEGGKILPAELIYLSPTVPDLILLKELK